MAGIEEVEAILRDPASGLREKIVRDIGCFTVSLLSVTQPKGSDFLELAGTGTLVGFGGSRYILTAAHVWEEKLKRAERIGITLKEDVDRKYLIDPDIVIPFIPDMPQEWNEWGPDLALLQIPSAVAEEITAIGQGVFYNLGRDRKDGFDGYCIELRLLMGTPKSLGAFTDVHADLQISGMFSSVEHGRFLSIAAPDPSRREYDYIDLDMDVALSGVPEAFGGVSGGGLWRVLVYSPASEIAWAKELEGVAFYESELVEDHRVLRCYGPQSIGTLVRLVV